MYTLFVVSTVVEGYNKDDFHQVKKVAEQSYSYENAGRLLCEVVSKINDCTIGMHTLLYVADAKAEKILSY